AVFPNLEVAKSSLGSKAPFNSWHPQALHAYLACGGLRPLHSSSSSSAAAAACLEFPPKASLATSTSTATCPAISSAACKREGHTQTAAEPSFGAVTLNLDISSNAAAVAAATTASQLTLSCAPENEARVYEALHPPPWRPWQHLRTSFGANPKVAGCSLGADNQGSVARGCDQGSSRSNNSSSNSHGGSSSNASSSRRLADDERHLDHRTLRGSWLAIAVGREVGLHAQLARGGAQVAELVPGARLIRWGFRGSRMLEIWGTCKRFRREDGKQSLSVSLAARAARVAMCYHTPRYLCGKRICGIRFLTDDEFYLAVA
ncbi:hypothetical protein Vretifemale_15689, partial [Volvox reticuliferus]